MNRSAPFPVLSTASKGSGDTRDPWNDPADDDDGSIHDPFSPDRRTESLNHNNSQSSFSRRRRSMLLASSSFHSSSSRLMEAVTKTVQLGLQSIGAKSSSAHKSSHAAERYQEMPDDGLSRVMERSDEFTVKSAAGNAQLELYKGSNHSGRSSDQCSFFGDSTGQQDDEEDGMFMANDETPLRLPHHCLQMNFDTIEGEDVAPTRPTPSVPLTPKKRKNDATFGSDHRSIHPLHVEQPTRLSPRSLRKFRVIGISDSNLQPFHPKSPQEEEEDMLTLATPLRHSPTRHSPRRRLQSRRKPLPLTAQLVLDRMSFGPSSQHYCVPRGSVGRTLPRSSPQHSDWKPSVLVRKEFISSQSYHTPVSNDSPPAVDGSKLHSTRTYHGDRMRFGPEAPKMVSTIPGEEDKPQTPVPPRRERVQFDFNPKDIDELSRAIAAARLRGPVSDDWNGSHHHQTMSAKPLVPPLVEPKRQRRKLSSRARGLPRFQEL
jgi:hypothetical protein